MKKATEKKLWLNTGAIIPVKLLSGMDFLSSTNHPPATITLGPATEPPRKDAPAPPDLLMPTLTQPDTELHYELSGQGIPILLIQGVGVTAEGWRPQLRGWDGQFQSLASSIPLVHGCCIGRSVPCRGSIRIESMAADARALLDAAGWESAHVVGHSMGGVIAQQLALDCPSRVRSLSLLCTFARGKEAARLTPWVLWMTLRTRVGSRRMRRRAFLEMLVSKEDLRTADIDRLAAEVAVLVGRDLADQPPILIKQLMAMGRHDQVHRLRELATIPTYVLSAEQDRIALPRFGRSLARSIPGARYEEFPGASHGVTLRRADDVTEKLAQFIRSVERSRAGLPGGSSPA